MNDRTATAAPRPLVRSAEPAPAPAGPLSVDAALVPAQAAGWRPSVCIVVDELRASSTITTALDLGASEVVLAAGLREARQIARDRGSLLFGERGGLTPPGFDANNSPDDLRRVGVHGRRVVLSTTNGTAVLSRVRRMPVVLVGCLLNARACADAAVAEAAERGIGIGVICAGRRGGFALDDAVAAGLIVRHIAHAAAVRGLDCRVTDAARATLKLRAAYPDYAAALRESASGHVVAGLGQAADIELCAQADISVTVPILRPETLLRVERLPGRLWAGAGGQQQTAGRTASPLPGSEAAAAAGGPGDAFLSTDEEDRLGVDYRNE
jgi:2-phosphosulfolactate phosphatase